MSGAGRSGCFPGGWGVATGLSALLFGACVESGPGPVGQPVEAYLPPLREPTPEGPRVVNHGPADRLIVRTPGDERSLMLLFLDGRAATPLRSGGSAWADLEGGRVVTFDSRGVVEAVLGGAPALGPPLSRPVFVAARGPDLLAVEIDGQALRFAGDEPAGWVDTGLPAAVVGGAGQVLAATRTVFDIHLAPLRPEEPLLWVSDRRGTRSVGRVRVPEQAMLAAVVNAGWVAPRADGSVVFASAVRPELSLYAPDGDREWVATWPSPDVVAPRLIAQEGALMPSFRLIQQAVVTGPDERIYVLGTTGEAGPADRLLVFDGDGVLLGEGEVPPDAAIYVAPRGHVYALEKARALSRTDDLATDRRFASFDLPALDGLGRVRLSDHAGKVVVVNFWASWCAPCRREMPLLDALASELGPDRVAVVGLNEDVDPASAVAFLDEIGGVSYPIAEGRGRLREAYGYRGLPYTVVLDPSGEVTRAIYGFGASIAPVREAVREARDLP